MFLCYFCIDTRQVGRTRWYDVARKKETTSCLFPSSSLRVSESSSMWACGHIFTFISVLSLFFFCFLKPPPTPSIAFHPTHIFIPCHFLLFSSPRRRRRWFVVYNNNSIHRSAGTWMRQTTYGTAAAAAARGSYLETRMTTLTCVFVMPSKVAFISFPFLSSKLFFLLSTRSTAPRHIFLLCSRVITEAAQQQ